MKNLGMAQYELEGVEKDLLKVTRSILYLADTFKNMEFARVKNNKEFENIEERLSFYENAFENAAGVLHVLIDIIGETGDRLIDVKDFLKEMQK